MVPFGASEGAIPGVDVAAVISADLARSGRFKPMPARDMLATPHSAAEVDLRDWRLLGMQHLVVGNVTVVGGGFQIDYVLFDVFSGDQLLGDSTRPPPAGCATPLTASPMPSTRSSPASPGSLPPASPTSPTLGMAGRVTLRVCDADGHGAQTIVSSNEPILSPAWSPDGQRLAYVSFENRRAAIYVQDVGSGRRDLGGQLPRHQRLPGLLAGWPVAGHDPVQGWKSRTSMSWISSSRSLRQITDHLGIDTEPAWSPDGNTIVFTSNRGGGPQIYKVSAAGGPAERVTFQNDYNAWRDLLPGWPLPRPGDPRRWAVPNRHADPLVAGSPRIMSRGTLDESPSFAPNGSMVIYATHHNGRGVLAATSVDGRVNQRLSQDTGEVREPAWSPMVH